MKQAISILLIVGVLCVLVYQNVVSPALGQVRSLGQALEQRR